MHFSRFIPFILLCLSGIAEAADQKPVVVNPTTGRNEQLQAGNNLALPDASGDLITVGPGVQTAPRTITLPVMTGNRTLAVIDEAQTFSAAQTIASTLAVTGTTTLVTIQGPGNDVGYIQARNAANTAYLNVLYVESVDTAVIGIPLRTAGAVAMSSTLAVTGATTFANTVTMPNNTALQWNDSAANARRTELLTAANDFFIGPIDAGWSAGLTQVRAGTDFQVLVNGASGAFVTPLIINSAGAVAIKAGTSSSYAKAGGALFYSTTAVGNVGVGDDVLMTTSIPANSLATDGDSIEGYASGTFATSANNKRIRVKFGATTIFDSGALAITSASDWILNFRVIRTGAATQKCCVNLSTSSATLSAYADYATAAETLSGAVTMTVNGEGTADNDIVAELWKGSWSSAP